jgi:hypothetical protein
MGSLNTAEFFIKLGNRWNMVLSITPWTLYPEEAGNSDS